MIERHILVTDIVCMLYCIHMKLKTMHQVPMVSTGKTGWGNNEFHTIKALVDNLVSVNTESKCIKLKASIVPRIA